jgi:hypothetical protein
MANDDSQSISRDVLVSDIHPSENNVEKRSPNLSITKPGESNGKWTLRNSISSASFRRYRSSFRRAGMNTGPSNSQYSSSPSFPLFRHFYLMRSSLKRRRPRDLPESIGESFAITSTDKLTTPLRIETSHIFTTIFITIASACLLISMIFLDFAYLNDAIMTRTTTDELMLSSNINSSILCLRHPKVCVMKGLVVFVFVSVTIVLCYTILTLYTRARRHSRLLERKTDELEKEKCLTEKLLHEILPPCVAKDLINGRKAPAEYYESVTVYFSDIVGFTIIAR